MSTTSPITAPSSALATAIEEFGDPRGYLAVASIGIPPRRTVEALRADLDAWSVADRDPQGYDPVIARTRESYARLVGIGVDRVAIGSQTSVAGGARRCGRAERRRGADDRGRLLLADGAVRELAPTSGSAPFRSTALADSITDDTWLVVFSLVQSSTGVVADVDAITEAAARHNALTFCDTTQAAGVLPVDATRLRLHGLPHLQVAVLAARRRLPHDERARRIAAHSRPRPAGTRATTRGRTATARTSTSLPVPAGSTSPRPGRPGSAPSSRSACSPTWTSPRSGSAAPGSATRSATPSASRSSTRRSWPGRTPPDTTCAP